MLDSIRFDSIRVKTRLAIEGVMEYFCVFNWSALELAGGSCFTSNSIWFRVSFSSRLENAASVSPSLTNQVRSEMSLAPKRATKLERKWDSFVMSKRNLFSFHPAKIRIGMTQFFQELFFLFFLSLSLFNRQIIDDALWTFNVIIKLMAFEVGGGGGLMGVVILGPIYLFQDRACLKGRISRESARDGERA